MQLSSACTNILKQLSDILLQIDHEDFVIPAPTLGQSTIGQHIRHTLEFFLCLEQGIEQGTVNYDRRAHDKSIETDKHVALDAINRIHDFVATHKLDQPLQLEVGYQNDTDDFLTIDTNYFRELSYNIEHAVHHMAIIKIGLREVAPYVQFPDDFGIAASTIRYMAKLVPSR